MTMETQKPIPGRDEIEAKFRAVRRAMVLIQLLIAAVIVFPLYMYFMPKWNNYKQKEGERNRLAIQMQQEASQQEAFETLWKGEIGDSSDISTAEWELIQYGKELVTNTARYLGPKGSVVQVSNGMNCQNCHLEAGTRPWGNNYGAVASTYPKYRARSGGIEDITKRVNDCVERSLNGKALKADSKEMSAFVAYIRHLGRDVEKGSKPPGSGIYELALPTSALDSAAGHAVYLTKCASCHQADGQGVKDMEGIAFTYPPLWGKNSYNQGAGLYRMSRFAGYVRYNMPQGASFLKPQLTDEEAWNLAAYVNSQPRPSLDLSKDWPRIEEKPFDHPFGPYADAFSEQQHKYGPFGPIKAFYKKDKK
jgi:thiosulfate dehydrogenase